MEWLVVAGRISAGFLANPEEFLSKPGQRIQPGWAYGLVEAANEDEAYDRGLDAWGKGLLVGQQPGDQLINWYVAPSEEPVNPTSGPIVANGTI